MKYRAEIDGLRAVAVIPVILFHAGIETFAGGFVGVDVFFVISGFLITNILIEDIENNNFSLINFYERRCRRIIPALFFMILVCMPFAWAWMLPSQMKDFSASVISVATFLSNFHFTFKGDYFGISVEEMPLLHTWSLAVEEQFYIVFPIFLFLFWRFGKRNVLLVVIGLALASLALSQLATIYTAGRLNFFFTPSRVWELLAGTIAAFIVQKQGVKSNNLLSVVGLLAIATAIAVYDEKTPFPSAYTLLPVVGTAMFLVFADAKTMGAKILGFKAFVGIGLISYSAYLWHQPLFAFARIRLSFEPSIQLMLFLSLLSLVLGYLSWQFIEKPFRGKRGRCISRNQIFFGSFAVILVSAGIGFAGTITNGFQDQMLKVKYTQDEAEKIESVFSAMAYNMYENMEEVDCRIWVRDTKFLDLDELNICEQKFGRATVLIGDSHAMNLYNIMSFSNHYSFLIGVSRGGYRAHNQDEGCHFSTFREFLTEHKDKVSNVVYHQSGSYFVKDRMGKVDSQSAFEGEFSSFSAEKILQVRSYLEAIADPSKYKIHWIGPFLEYRWNPEKFRFEEKFEAVNPQSVEIFDRLEDAIVQLLSGSEVIHYHPYNQLFWEPTTAFHKDCFIFRDNDHYSKCGEKLIADRVDNNFLNNEITDANINAQN